MPLTNRKFDICPGKYLGDAVLKYPIFAVTDAGTLGASDVDTEPTLIPFTYTVIALPVETVAKCTQAFNGTAEDDVTTYWLTLLYMPLVIAPVVAPINA